MKGDLRDLWGVGAQGDTVWSFGVEHVYNKDLSDTLPKLRELAKKVVK